MMNRLTLRSTFCCCAILLATAVVTVRADDLQADVKRLQEMAQMFNPSLFPNEAEQAAEVCKQIAPAKEERRRIEQKYTDAKQARQIKGVLGHFNQVIEGFEKAAAD